MLFLIKSLNSKEVFMIKIRSVLHSNLFFGAILFLSFLLTWGCSKNVAPPDVEGPEVVEAIPEPEAAPEEAPAESGPESGFGIAEDGSVLEENVFETEGPAPVEEEIIAEVFPEPEPIQEEEFVPEPEPFVAEEEVFVPEPFVAEEEVFVPEPEPEVVEEVVEEVIEEPVELQEEVFVAPAPEPEPVQEARTLPFEDEQQLQDIHFAYDRDALDSQNKTILRANVKWLKSNPNARVEIQGHADERGTNNYNLGLGERRALQTKRFLITQGIDESRLYTISYGEEKPFCFDSSEDCWWQNRRAHFTVAD